MTNDDSSPGTSPKVNRRGLIGGLAIGSIAVGAGAVGAVASRASARSGFRRERLVVEVACLGELFRYNTRANAKDDADTRGAFIVEGRLYPEGTIKGDGFIPREEGSIGRWFCRGAFIVDGSRPQPHTYADTMYVFGRITKDALFPRDSIQTNGLEGTDDRTQICWRSVVGGTGKYMGASGEMGERFFATNTSASLDGKDDSSPCWRHWSARSR